MVNERRPVNPSEISPKARHVLYVEGSGPDALDPVALKQLFENRVQIRVKHLGASNNLRATSGAMFPEHPDWYFLIDRDHRGLDEVEKYWNYFPNPENNNLLFWRKRELENYFLDPAYIVKSEYFMKDKYDIEKLKKIIIEECKKRIYLDAANYVIISTWKDMKSDWIKSFRGIEGFDTKENALEKLINVKEFSEKSEAFSKKVTENNLRIEFEKTVDELFDGSDELEFGKGTWLERVNGKHVFNVVMDRCFRVENRNGDVLQGKKANERIVMELLKMPLGEQPDDFQELLRLIKKRVKSGA